MTRSVLLASTAFALGLALLAGSLLGCGDGPEWRDLKQQSREAWDAAKTWGVSQRREAEKLFSESMDALPQRLEAAKARARAAGGEAANSLDARREDVSRKLAEMKAAGAEKWAEARDAFVRAYEALERDLSPGR